jgi:galacturan 1,4-alpha-galacturonidase
MSTLKYVSILSILGLSCALPSNVLQGTSQALEPRAACTPTAGGSSSIDDTPAIASAISSCGNGGTIVIPAGTTYYLNTYLDFSGCSGCDFQVEGLLKFTSDTDYWEGKTAMINVEDIDGLQIRSLTGSGVIDGNGQDA